MRRIIIIILAVLCVGYVVWNRYGQEDAGNKMYGSVDIREASPAFEISGRVAEIKALEGQKVQQGEVLATLDTTTLELDLKRAEIAVTTASQNLQKLKNGSRVEEIAAARAATAKAEAAASLASLTYKRKKSVFERTKGSGVSQAELDEARMQTEVTEAALKEAKAHEELVENGARAEDIALAESNLKAAENEVAVIKDRINKAVLKAPAAGTIRNRYIEVGDLTGASVRAYALSLTSQKRVRVYALYGQLPSLHVGGKVKIYFGNQGQSLDGTLSFVSSVAEFTPKNVETEELRPSLVYEVQAIAQDPDDLLRLGMPVTVEPLAVESSSTDASLSDTSATEANR